LSPFDFKAGLIHKSGSALDETNPSSRKFNARKSRKDLPLDLKPYKAFEACPNNCPKASYNAPGSPKQSFANTPDVYDVLTDIKAIVTKIWDKLSHEMPSDDQF
jgi:hypothetical protein